MTPGELVGWMSEQYLTAVFKRADDLIAHSGEILAVETYSPAHREAAQWILARLPDAIEQVQRGGPYMLHNVLRLAVLLLEATDKLWHSQNAVLLPHMEKREKGLRGASDGGATRALSYNYEEAKKIAKQYKKRQPDAGPREIARHIEAKTGIPANTTRTKVNKWIGASH